MKYILSIGTNIGDRKKNMEDAVSSLNLVPKTKVIKVSSIYETEPVGYEKQDDFYNCAVLVDSALAPNEMLGVCLGIEAGFGRVRVIRNGPRVLDMDLILAENFSCDTENLTLPHPRFSERRFVLAPMLELFPQGTAFGVEFSHFMDHIEGQNVRIVSNT